MKIINLTPHDVVVGDTTYPPSGDIARVREKWVSTRDRPGDPGTGYAEVTYSDPVIVREGKDHGMWASPELADTKYIVSNIVALMCRDREDLLIPGKPVRDAEGKVIGCECLARPVYQFEAKTLCELIRVAMRGASDSGYKSGRSA
jgi:hypothetical protein